MLKFGREGRGKEKCWLLSHLRLCGLCAPAMLAQSVFYRWQRKAHKKKTYCFVPTGPTFRQADLATNVPHLKRQVCFLTSSPRQSTEKKSNLIPEIQKVFRGNWQSEKKMLFRIVILHSEKDRFGLKNRIIATVLETVIDNLSAVAPHLQLV